MNLNKKNTNQKTQKEKTGSKKAIFFSAMIKFIHEPIRLQILALLNAVQEADMKFLQKELDVSWGNLSFHSTQLEEKEFIVIKKQFIGKKSFTLLTLTPHGKQEFKKYCRQMKNLIS